MEHAERGPVRTHRHTQVGRLTGLTTGSEPWPGRTEGAWNNLGLFQREAGQLDDAERSFREALRMRPDYDPAIFNLAVLERTRGNWDSAKDWLFRSLQASHPEPEETLLQWVFLADQARRVVRSLSLDPAQPPIREALRKMASRGR